jgi:hypothetical protein
MSGYTRFKLIAGLVFNSIWLVVALFLWIGGLVCFIEEKDNMGFGAWAVWGVMCALPMAGHVLRSAIESGRDNARDGARVYTASLVGDTVTFRDNSASYGFWGFIGGLIGGVLLGPVILPLIILGAVKKIIVAALTLKHSVSDSIE